MDSSETAQAALGQTAARGEGMEDSGETAPASRRANDAAEAAPAHGTWGFCENAPEPPGK
ncbi:MAG: hypothetical protein Q4F41_16795 [Eubacteriales bacterium]|nr:hypothetical protein [Eubacteriales bacterium]